MSTNPPSYPFFTQLARTINSGQSRSVLLSGNVHDLFYTAGEPQGQYVPLVSFLCEKCRIPGMMLLVYELNGPIRFVNSSDESKLRDAWLSWSAGTDINELTLQGLSDKKKSIQTDELKRRYDQRLLDCVGQPTVALEMLRQLCLCSRSKNPQGRTWLSENLFILIEAAEMVLPLGDGDISRLNVADRHRVSICRDWFSDPGFMNGQDSVVLLTESQSLIHPQVSRLPQVLSIEVPNPDLPTRQHYIDWFTTHEAANLSQPPKMEISPDQLAHFTAGLSIHALRQLLLGATYQEHPLRAEDVVHKVEHHIQAQLGEDVIEFKKPSHTLEHVVGFSQLKSFLHAELIPRFQSAGDDALPGAAVAGPIGGGKTFIFEAVAGALDLPVLVLKNIRSQYFGQTDVLFEQLRRTLESLQKVVIFVDEADTQFGGVGAETHATERRLTGKIQGMMSDSKLRGKVIWLLMTARIHLLSPDIRRPGRVGDLIIPVLDPVEEDRGAFIRWVLEAVIEGELDDEVLNRFDKITQGYSAAQFASLRSNLKAQAKRQTLDIERIEAIVYDQIPPAIEQTRRYQTLQALLNCTRRRLLPNPDVSSEQRHQWQMEIRRLEAEGIR